MKNENSRDTILTSALKLFSEKGYDAVSVNEIVEMAGITKPTLYYFFGSKEGLFKELLKTNYDLLNTAVTDACRYDPHREKYYEDVFPVLLKIAKTYFSFAKAHREFYLMSLSLTFTPQTSSSAMIAEEYHKVQYMLVEKTFKDISEVHRNMNGRERFSSWHFLAMINAQIAFWSRGYGKLENADAELIVRQFMHGMFS